MTDGLANPMSTASPSVIEQGRMNGASDVSSSEPPPETGPEQPRIVRRSSSHRTAYVAAAVVIIVIVVVVASFAAGWFKTSSESAPAGTCPTQQTLLGDGANFVLPLVSTWTNAYGSVTSNNVNYNAAGAGAGITALTDKTVDFAATDEPLNSSQFSGLPSTTLTLPIAAGALAIVYNLPTVATPVQLSGTVLAGIYLGTINNWDDSAIADINPSIQLPNAAITTVHRSDAAGTTFVLTDYLSEDNATWKAMVGVGIQPSWPAITPTPEAIKGNSALAAYVQKTPDTIGYVDLTDGLNTPGLQYANVLNPAGHYIRPTLADAASAITNMTARTTFPAPTASWANVSMVNSPGTSDYPLATFSYFMVFQAVNAGYAPSLQKAQALVQWLNWTITIGQTYSKNLYYVAVPSSLVALDESALKTMTFDGTAIPACTTG
ncbi:MAG: phosphate ABC transporter substrate-binding protein PstS [Thermoplasmata archaeon]